jgi:hypothetical protein
VAAIQLTFTYKQYSSTVHIYTQTVHRIRRKEHTKQQQKVGKCRPCPVFASYTLAFALQLRKNPGKKLRVFRQNNAILRERLFSSLSHFSFNIVAPWGWHCFAETCRSNCKRKIKKYIIQCVWLVNLYVVDNARYKNKNSLLYVSASTRP